jgi:hypothetical protein
MSTLLGSNPGVHWSITWRVIPVARHHVQMVAARRA